MLYSDKDSVPDLFDSCVDLAEDVNGVQDEDGCLDDSQIPNPNSVPISES